MTPFQLVSSAIALVMTIHCVPMRKGERFTTLGMFLWVASVAVTAVAFVGLK